MIFCNLKLPVCEPQTACDPDLKADLATFMNDGTDDQRIMDSLGSQVVIPGSSGLSLF